MYNNCQPLFCPSRCGSTTFSAKLRFVGVCCVSEARFFWIFHTWTRLNGFKPLSTNLEMVFKPLMCFKFCVMTADYITQPLTLSLPSKRWFNVITLAYRLCLVGHNTGQCWSVLMASIFGEMLNLIVKLTREASKIGHKALIFAWRFSTWQSISQDICFSKRAMQYYLVDSIRSSRHTIERDFKMPSDVSTWV